MKNPGRIKPTPATDQHLAKADPSRGQTNGKSPNPFPKEQVHYVTIKVPIALVKGGNVQRRIDVMLSNTAAEAFTAVFHGLDIERMSVPDRHPAAVVPQRRIVTHADAARWLLETVADAIQDLKQSSKD